MTEDTMIPYQRGVFCNRTLNLRSIKAIGYDMDYTLIHYNVEAWEGKAYEHVKKQLSQAGWSVEKLQFNPRSVMRGLIIDKELGNILKVNRFGYIKKGTHGTQKLESRNLRKIYSRTIVDLSNPRYAFMNTLFDISEACIYSQLVDLLDEKKLPGVMGYRDLYVQVRTNLNHAHIEGQMKEEIMASPQDFVELDPQTAITLLDQKYADKKLMLITNSEWKYTKFMMSYAFDRFLPEGTTWRDIFDIVVVSSRKPAFFSGDAPTLKIANEDGLLEPVIAPKGKGIYFGSNAKAIEQFLGLSGDEILYVGDHLFGDVNVSKNILSWRTALIIRELEEELEAVYKTHHDNLKLREKWTKKERLEATFSKFRLALQRHDNNYGNQIDKSPATLKQRMHELREQLVALDKEIEKELKTMLKFNETWGYLMRTANDKSHMTRQIERYADVYTSRVSNFMYYTPFMYFHSRRGSLPHDPVYTTEITDLPPTF